MSLRSSCPKCGQHIEVEAADVGAEGECPTCSHVFKIQAAAAVAPPPIQPTQDNRPIHACPFCGEMILVVARKCKHCGELLDASLKEQRQQQSAAASSTAPAAPREAEKEKTEYQSHPSMFRNNPIGFILSLILIAAYGLGLIILLIWWLRCLGTTLTITNKKSILRKGILSKHTSEVYHSDVRNVQVGQSLFQRMFEVGTIGISSAGQSGVEIGVAGIPRPAKVKDIIDKHRRD